MEQVGSSNHKFIKTETEVRMEVTISVAIRAGIDQIGVTEDNTNKTEVGLDMNKIIGEDASEET